MKAIRTYVYLLISLLSVSAYSDNTNPITLNSHCPPSFEKTNEGCKLVSLYQFYDSLNNQGVGGTQTSLPSYRDGFSPEQIDLGRYLFFDPLLSKNQKQSCASCHQPQLGFSDGLARSVGTNGDLLKRSAPTLWNVAFLKRFFWDARANSLEEQAKGPLFDNHEMANDETSLLAALNANQTYRALFKTAFNSAENISLDQVVTSLSAFQSSLISLNSRYDHYVHGDHNALSEEEIQGMNVFRSFVARCAECHTPPLFTNQQVAVIGVDEPEGLEFDIGAEKTFNNAKVKGGFKVPTLRNITKTAPYMHSGRFSSLRDAVEFYTLGRGHAVKDQPLYLHWHIWEPNLRDEEIDQIVAFLGALEDQTLTPKTPKRVPSGLTPITHFQTTNESALAE
ncbi:cytochrome-c peroxidase [Pseudoalteromonas sp. SSM20]|uniref:cytochrome-c peroxidase n=1 Tax=Pseudoalteromonas sp. SSM20 TaxID=3139394 RepID=UPI003BA88923